MAIVRPKHRTELILRATRRVLTNFDRYSIKVDMMDVGNPWTFSLWHSSNAESAWAMMLHEVKLGGYILFTIDGAPQLTGKIESFTVRTTRQGCCLVISGRDLAGPAIDWEPPPSISLRNRPLDECLQALFRPLEIPVVIGINADAEREVRTRTRPGARGSSSSRSTRRQTVDLAHPRPNETYWQVATSIVKRLGYMMWIAPSANGELAIVIDTPNYSQTPLFLFKRRLRNGKVTSDSNILESDFHAQIRTIPTKVFAFGRERRGNRAAASVGASSSTRGLINLGDLPPSVLGNIGQGVFTSGLSPAVEFTQEQTRAVLDTLAAPYHGSSSRNSRRSRSRTTQSQYTNTSTQRPEARATRMQFSNNELTQWSFVQQPLPAQTKFLHSPRARNPATGGQEAKRFIAHAMKDFRTIAVVVAGHGQTIDGQMRLYAPNVMARYIDDYIDVDEDMLITCVEFEGSRQQGQETKITLGTKNAITLEPEAS